MTGPGDSLKVMVTSQAQKHAASAKSKAAAASTSDNSGADDDVLSQIDAVLTANPPSWLF